METKYCADTNFPMIVKGFGIGQHATLTEVDGGMRWVITPIDGEPYILRPESARPTNA